VDKTTAQRRVRETLKAPFDKKRYRDFINEICNGIDESKVIPSMAVPDAFAPHIKSCQRLGTFESPDGELTDVLVVHLTESFKLERTRTALRDFVAHKLKRDESYKEASLVAFVAPDSQSWRFSYVRMEYETKRDPRTGKIKPEERLTPARRYSYLVGTDEECHTAQTRFLSLLQNTNDSPTLAQIEEAFSVESVTEEFFREYVRLFDDTEAALAAVVKRDKAIRDDFKEKGVSTIDFAKKLLGQIVFLYFIQKKGWLGVARGGNWGDGPRNFLRQLADRAIREKRGLFNDVLEPLFYDTLATDRGHEAWCKIFACRIPFLNGGLFEPLAGYEWKKTDIDLPNALFTNTTRSEVGDTGTGILDVFDRYNFTVNEAEPLEQEVAIDPEMLGKVFENLIEDNRRKGLGAFYTPREIVHFMCQESLINYLDTRLNNPTAPIGAATPQPEKQPPLFLDSSEKSKARPAQEEFTDTRQRVLVARKDLEVWIRQSDQFAHYAAAIAAGTRGDNYPKPPDSIRKFAGEIDALLRDITVCDPAIGSGAFPVGMMTEIVRARLALTPYFNDVAERTAYHFKRHVIQSSIYGVDIDPGAVEIAKLRLWLSLVVDEDDVQQIKPLPNLDYKIVVGNSLLGFPFKSQRVQKIEKLKAEYFDETNHDKKQRLKREIDSELAQAFAASKGSLGYEVAFDFQIYFSEIFRANKGFDVVIANPPYVRHETISEMVPMLRQRYTVAASRADLLIFFYEEGVNLLRTGGVLTLITSNKFHRAGYGSKLRPFLTDRLQIETLVDFGDAPVFDAIAYASILIGTKGSASGEHQIRACTWRPENDFSSLPQTLASEGIALAQRQLAPDGWRLESPAAINLLEKLRKAGTPLGEYVGGKFYYGIKTGLNEAFVLTREQRDQLIAEDRKSAKLIKPFLRGRDVKRWMVRPHDLFLIVFPHGFHGELKSYPAILRHLTRFQAQLKDRGQCKSSRGNKEGGQHHWLELDNNPKQEYLDCFATEKLIMPAIERSSAFAVDQAGHYSNDKTSICVAEDSQALCAILNSKVLWWTLTQIAATKQNGYYEFKPLYVRQLPIPPASGVDKAKLTKLAERAAKVATGGDDVTGARIEREIDEIIYRLFDLTAGEITQIETAVANLTATSPTANYDE
jgi:type I restriction-modification system DNA methylase subunit